jgi:hypothetical protein
MMRAFHVADWTQGIERQLAQPRPESKRMRMVQGRVQEFKPEIRKPSEEMRVRNSLESTFFRLPQPDLKFDRLLSWKLLG